MNYKVTILSLLCLVLYSCIGNDEFKVNGNIKNAAGKQLVLKEMTTSNLRIVDSVELTENGKFELESKIDRIAFYMLEFNNERNNYITLIAKPGDRIQILADGTDLSKTYTIEGSEESMLVKELNESTLGSIDQVILLGKIYQDSLGSPNILKIREELDSAYESILSKQKDFTKNFIEKHPNNLASLMALYQQLSQNSMVMSPTEDFEYFEMVDSSLMKIYPEAESVQSLHSMIEDFRQRNLQKQELEKRVGLGALAPEIALPSPKGDTIRLSSMKGKYILLDFWASWCTPCRNENPNLVKNYWKYRGKGFDIFQVSIDRTKEAWTSGIATDRLHNWTHVSDLKYWDSPVVKLYGFEGIPHNLLIDRDGRIVAKDLRSEDLGYKLKEIFKY